eukprot:5524789-Alexandrium_andersonii.AAC.1
MGEDCAAPPTPAPQGQLPRQRAFFENSFGQRIPVMFLSGTGPCSNPSCFACVERKGHKQLLEPLQGGLPPPRTPSAGASGASGLSPDWRLRPAGGASRGGGMAPGVASPITED